MLCSISINRINCLVSALFDFGNSLLAALIYEIIIYFAIKLNYELDTPYPIIDIANFKRNFEKSIMNSLYRKHLEEK